MVLRKNQQKDLTVIAWLCDNTVLPRRDGIRKTELEQIFNKKNNQ
jgi:hypothetical protein